MDRLNISKNNDWIGISSLAFNVWMILLEADSQFEKVILKQDNCQVEIIKLLNNSLLTLRNKSFSTSLAVTEKEYEKIKANLDVIHNKIRKKRPSKIEENELKRSKPAINRKRRIIPQSNIDLSSATDESTTMCDLSFLDIPPPPYSLQG